MKYIARSLEALEAWKYDPELPIPVWVARKCHYLGDGKFTANTTLGAILVEPGDYIILMSDPDEPIEIAVCDGKGFDEKYIPF